ncbi:MULTISPECIES: methyl-accepting chemotaxis protein [unclassified Candidatus Frackibacter]|uniref:methyl-accepting chemotaxis protein n=1 Tax=unclassified Candidatus Frackibacter TaxID=2648818 RepID=UPI0008860BCF|nr:MULTISPECIES: methyl-accepting chemotaxis protein [unclassified Candidatus Frackibacter]SDC79114.1 Methyl-accepting chemotaxis protein [Candidatus Frackibacter sp. WG11]SEM91869.1 Methyl-accepting chemotaxis protein [Candidatus Frackibacter sp. WG12]SFM01643.1 Methyl-accepting chemotaxis protein [Candidatus Frackibacter sp. WG13]
MLKRLNSNLRVKMIGLMLVVIIGTLAIISGYIIYKNRVETMANFKRQGELLADVIKTSSANAETAYKSAEKVLEKEMIAEAQLIADLLNEGDINNQDLIRLSKKTGIDEFWITNGQGTVTLTNFTDGLGWTFPDDPKAQAYEFRKILDNPDKVVAQKAMVRDVDGKLFKFVGVSRKDKPGIVQVGMDASFLKQLEDKIGLQSILKELSSKDEIDYITVLDKDKEVVAKSGIYEEFASEIKKASKSDDIFKEVINEAAVKTQLLNLNDHHIYQIVLPYKDGALNIGISFDKAMAALVQTRNNVIIISIILLVGAAIIINLFAKRISRPILDLVNVSNLVAAGDFSQQVEVKSKDEIGQLEEAYNYMLETIRGIINGIYQNAEQLETVLQEATANIVQINQNTGQSAESVDEVSKVIGEVAATIEELSERSQEMHIAGSKTFEEMQHTDKDIKYGNKILDSATQAVQDLEERVERISQISNTIMDITEQTNLLALNAAIEAARAGEEGKGFAVVAEEVRELAERSSKSAKQIQNITEAVKDATKKMKEITVGTEKSKQNSIVDVFDSISDSSGSITSNMNKVIEISEAQSSKTEETSASTEEIWASTEEVNSKFEEVSDSIDQLQSMLEQIAKDSERLVNDIDDKVKKL